MRERERERERESSVAERDRQTVVKPNLLGGGKMVTNKRLNDRFLMNIIAGCSG